MTTTDSTTSWAHALTDDEAEAARAYIADRVVVDTDTGCWLWKLSLSKKGYGMAGLRHCTTRWAHRLSYLAYVGPIPPALEIDHLCHRPDECADGSACPHRRCCNPEHLEAVTSRENTARGGSPAGVILRTGRCQQGHRMTESNVVWRANGRRCRTCREGGVVTPRRGTATAWLVDYLNERGGSAPTAEVLAAAPQAGHSLAAAASARRSLGVVATRTPGGWVVALPPRWMRTPRGSR